MFVSNTAKHSTKMGNDRFIFNKTRSDFNSKVGIATICVVKKNNQIGSVKSQLVKRSSDDLKKSRVSAYSYLIP